MDVVIFGLGRFASLAWYVLTHDSPHRVVGFTADRAYCLVDRLHDLPVVPFEALEPSFAPSQVRLLLALGGRQINGLRADRFLAARRRGYGFLSYVASRALVWPDLKIGENCMLFEGCTVHPFATIGDNCILRSGSHVSHHATVADHCFLAAHALVAGSASIGERCFLGLNSTVRDSVQVAPRCFVAAGAVVTANTTEGGVYMGVPAKRHDMASDQVDP
jgi:sugar O-acyltransferase (sialic acid O-acetyltransferase NeuD family)